MMSDNSNDLPAEGRLNRKIRLARYALFWESLWPALWPLTGVAGLFLCAVLFDVFPQLAPWLHLTVLAGFAAAFVLALRHAARTVVFPDHQAGRRRVEVASKLDHRPLTAVQDSLPRGTENGANEALWRLHQQRMAEMLRTVRAGTPKATLSGRDPLALRAGLLLALFVAVIAGWDDAPDRMKRAFLPQFVTATEESTVAMDIWIAPPEYTGLPPIFPARAPEAPPGPTESDQSGGAQEVSKPIQPALEIPAGSQVTAQVQGAKSATLLFQPFRDESPEQVPSDATEKAAPAESATERHPLEAVDGLNSRIVMKPEKSGTLIIEADGARLGEWKLQLKPDTPPAISFADKPVATAQATLRVGFAASDDYGIREAHFEVRRTYEKGTVIGKEKIRLPLPLPSRDARLASEAAFFDLSPHKWAGKPVVVQLVAKDVLGQDGMSKQLRIRLPERQFTHPVARAIIEQRRHLLSESPSREQVIIGLRTIASLPQNFREDVVIYMALTSASSRLIYERDDTAIDPVASLLWDTALRLEDGRVSVAEREMRRIQQELMRALAEGASQEKLDRLMRELQAAIARYMQALAEQMRRNPQSVKEVEFDPKTMRMMQQGDIQRMMQQIQNLMRSGARQAAREMLARLQQMLSNMRSMQVMRMRGGQMGRQGSALRKLRDLIRRQQNLMNRTFQFGRPGGNPQGQMPSPADQQALRDLLNQLRGQMPGRGQGNGPGQFLDRAGQAMQRAIDALSGDRPNDAVSQQGRALQQMRRAGQSILQQLREQFSRQSGIRNPRNQRATPLRDPLGRDIDEDEGFDDGEINIDHPSALKRTREILDELRKRSGERFRPRLELDYIDRLLDRF